MKNFEIIITAGLDKIQKICYDNDNTNRRNPMTNSMAKAKSSPPSSRNASIALFDLRDVQTPRILMITNRGGDHRYGLPGGGVELRNEEDDFPAAQRETEEEVPGLSSDYYDLDGARTDSRYVYWEMVGHHLKSIFLATLRDSFEPSTDPNAYQDNDVCDAEWITIERYRRERQSQIPPAQQRAIDWFLKVLNIQG
jgi:8-oxo-dGTP pyrophosphatase MutT (NUDIX family)